MPDKSWLYNYPGRAIRCLFEDTRNIQYDTIQIPKSESEIKVAPPSEQKNHIAYIKEITIMNREK